MSVKRYEAKAHPFIGATVGVKLAKRLNLVGVWSLDTDGGDNTAVAKLAVPLR